MKLRRILLSSALVVAVASVPLVNADAAAPLASASAATPPAAVAAHAEIMAIHATKEDGGGFVDERVVKLPHLRKKPFSDYNTFRVVEQKTIPLVKGEATSYALVTGRTLRVTLREVTADNRYALVTAIDRPGNTEYLKLLEVVAAPNEPFFVGGQSYRGGTLILSITVRP